MEDFPSTNEINTATDEQPSHFCAATGAGTSIPFYDNAHAIVLFSISHVGMPPIAADPQAPAVRFYGCFQNRALASAFARRVVACDPTCNIQMADTHRWILACATASKCTDAAYCDTKITRLLAHHATATESTKAAFIARGAALRVAGPEPEMRAEIENDMCGTAGATGAAGDAGDAGAAGAAGATGEATVNMDSGDDATAGDTITFASTPTDADEIQPNTVPADTAPDDTRSPDAATPKDTEPATPDADPQTASEETGSFLDATCALAHQSVLCVAFVKDELDQLEPEFMFMVLRSCKDETEAGGYIRGVASKHITDHSIDVVDLCTWGFPQGEQAIQTTYRNKQLDDIMRKDPIIPPW